jgi:hypothetical protein
MRRLLPFGVERIPLTISASHHGSSAKVNIQLGSRWHCQRNK